VVDEINDTEEIVVKPLSKQLKSINIYAGATIMGDGRVALILDVLGLAQRARVVGETHDRPMTEDEKHAATAAGAARRSMLLFQYGKNGRMAIDLSMVARLEEFQRDAIEIADGQEAVQYRGRIMPLVHVSEILQGQSVPVVAEGSVQVVVYTDQQRSVGLVIDRILDIVEDSFTIEPTSTRKGVLGSAVIQKRITDILDVNGLVAAAAERGWTGAAVGA
jgi:two-component system chemotaxis sensor kinase CheA